MNSFKKEMITAYAYSPEISILDKNNVVLLTPAGIITGKLINPDVKDDMKVEIFTNINNGIINRFTKDGRAVSGNDGFISLKDAVLLNCGHSVNIGCINVFFDQIIGVTIGNVE